MTKKRVLNTVIATTFIVFGTITMVLGVILGTLKTLQETLRRFMRIMW